MLTITTPTELFEDRELDQKWLIKGMIPRNEISLLFAPHSSYKTFTALAIGSLIMNLNESLGTVEKRNEEQEEIKVLYIPTEQTNTIKDRYRALEGRYGDKLPDVATQKIDLTNPESIRELAKTLKYHEYDLVVIDTVSKAIPAGDTANEDLVRRLLTACELFNECGTAVLLVHHTGHSELQRPKGSTLWLDNTSAVLTIQKTKKGKYHRVLKIVKSKSEREGERIPFVVEVVKVPTSTLWVNFQKEELDDLSEAIIRQVTKDPIDRNTIRKDIYPTFEDKYASEDSFRKVFNRKVEDLVGQEKIAIVRENRDVLLVRNEDI